LVKQKQPNTANILFFIQTLTPEIILATVREKPNIGILHGSVATDKFEARWREILVVVR